MTLFNALRRLPQMEVAALNFSSASVPELILKTFEQYCEYKKTPNGVVLAPIQAGKTVVVFMDECNLPAADKYSTVRVITFVRQLVEQVRAVKYFLPGCACNASTTTTAAKTPLNI